MFKQHNKEVFKLLTKNKIFLTKPTVVRLKAYLVESVDTNALKAFALKGACRFKSCNKQAKNRRMFAKSSKKVI